MKIRPAKKSDLNEISKIFRTEILRPPYNEKRASKKSLERVREFFKKKKIYVSTLYKEIIGFVVVSTDPDYPKKIYIDELWFKKKYQRKGMGQALMKYIEDIYIKKGIKIIKLVSSKKSGAFKFYKKLNFKESDFLFMEKKLK